MEEEDNIIVKWAQEDVETLYSLLNNNNNNNYSIIFIFIIIIIKFILLFDEH